MQSQNAFPRTPQQAIYPWAVPLACEDTQRASLLTLGAWSPPVHGAGAALGQPWGQSRAGGGPFEVPGGAGKEGVGVHPAVVFFEGVCAAFIM